MPSEISKKNLVMYKKGQSGNPRGRTPLPPEMKIAREVTREDLVQLGMMVFTGNVDALKDIIRRAEDKENPPTPMQVLMASCLIKAIQKGDVNVVNALLDRFFGKTPIAILVQASHRHVHMTEEQAREEAKRLLLEIK